MGVRQKNISGIFRRFLFSFLLAGAATILVLGVIVQILTIKAVIHPANYDEQQLEQKREEIQEAEKVCGKYRIRYYRQVYQPDDSI